MRWKYTHGFVLPCFDLVPIPAFDEYMECIHPYLPGGIHWCKGGCPSVSEVTQKEIGKLDRATARSKSFFCNYSDIIMSPMASQITSLAIVYSTVYSSADLREHQSYASLVFVGGNHRWPVNSPHKGPVTRKMFPFDDVIMELISTKVMRGSEKLYF